MARYFTSCTNWDKSLIGDKLPQDKLQVRVVTNALACFPPCVLLHTNLILRLSKLLLYSLVQLFEGHSHYRRTLID